MNCQVVLVEQQLTIFPGELAQPTYCRWYSGNGVASQYLVSAQGIHQQCISQQLSESHSASYGKAQPR